MQEALPKNLEEKMDNLISLIKTELKNVPENINKAYSHQEVDHPEKPDESSRTGGTLSVDGPPIEHNRSLLYKEYRAFFIAAKSSGLTLSMIEMKFERQKDGPWKHEMTFETFENKKALVNARKRYDEKMKKLIFDNANKMAQTWRSAEFSREMEKDDTFFLFLPDSTIQRSKPTDEMALTVKEVDNLYTSFGRSLRNIQWTVYSEDSDDVDVEVWNG
jgi:hypothetical protein